jgi:hypothetical protein
VSTFWFLGGALGAILQHLNDYCIPNFQTLLKLMYLVKFHRGMQLFTLM